MSHVSSRIRPLALAWLEQAGERRYVESETRIGRGEQNDIRLADPSVSRDHALIRRVDGVYLISDLDSANGTFVNDQRVYAPRALSAGDRIRLAEIAFTFNLDLPDVRPEEHAEQRVATSISQFLTISGQIDLQNYLQGDLRVVTVLFLDLCGFTALSEKMSPEQVTLVVNQCFQHLTETAIRFGGFVDKYIGDAMMILFGAPKAHDDDPERAVRAALAMQEALATYSQRLRQRSGIELQMRVGINTGEVLAGAVGSGQFSAFTVMGDTVNLASRLEGQARVGRIVVNETTFQQTKHLVRYAALPPTSIRGKKEMVSAYEVIGLLPEGSPAETTASGSLAGRHAELSLLETLLGNTGRLRSVMVCGPAGIGKSRLLDELSKRHAYHARLIVIRCADFVERGTQNTLRTLVEVVQGMVADDRQPEASEETPDALLSRLSAAVCLLAQNQSVILLIDRTDLADPATLALLERLAKLLVDADVLLVVATRGEPEGHWPTSSRVLDLRELTPDEARILVCELLQSNRVEAGTLDRLTGHCGSSPLLLEELVTAARTSGALEQVNGEWTLRGEIDIRHAFRLRTMVQAQLDRLTTDEHELLRLGSVVGGSWSARLVTQGGGAPHAPGQTLNHLVQLGILCEEPNSSEPRYSIQNELTRAVIDASLPQIERRRLHERIALALQGEYDPGRPDPTGLKRIAQHFAYAGQHWRGVEYLLRSADLAAGGATPSAAVQQYRLVLDEAQQVTDLKERARLIVELQERIGDALLKDGSLAEAQIAFELAASSASPQREADLCLKLAVTGVRSGNPRRVLEVTRRVLEQPGLTGASRASAEALAALSLASHGAVAPALERADRSLQLLAEGADPGTLGLAHFAAGRVHFVAGRLRDARHELQLSIASRAQASEQSAVAESHLLLGLIQCELGELDNAEASVRQAITPSSPADRWTRANAGLILGRLLGGRGEVSRARRHMIDALGSAEISGARELALELTLELADPSAIEADETIRSVLEVALARELQPVACRAQVRLASTLSTRAMLSNSASADVRQALKLAREATIQSRELGLELLESLARRVLAQVLTQIGHWPRAAREFEAAAVIQERLGATVELVRTLVAGCQAEYAHAVSPRVQKLRTDLARASELAAAVGLQREHGEAMHLFAALRE
jgi:class 3 adenylate cyclase/tetratricopeptide (TPR) repeat protein